MLIKQAVEPPLNPIGEPGQSLQGSPRRFDVQVRPAPSVLPRAPSRARLRHHFTSALRVSPLIRRHCEHVKRLAFTAGPELDASADPRLRLLPIGIPLPCGNW
jgi:hypothetical protein